MSPLTAQEMQQSVGMRPTLLIGLGGTGQKVLIQLKARFLRNYGQIPNAVEFLCFDTDQTAEQTQLNNQVVRLTGETELVNIGGIQTANIIRNLDKYLAIAYWIMEDKERIPTAAIQMGAKQVRPLGRLSFFWYVEMIQRKIQASVQRLTDLKLEIQQKGINVFIISSVCGGTGSGTFLDTAYLARSVIGKAGIDPEFCYINGVLALPSVFPNVEKTGIESNAFASLAELDYFIDTSDWTVEYGNPRVPTFSFSGKRPFNIVYLVDARNEQGQGLPGLEEVAPMLGEAIYLQISSQVGNANKSVFDNVDVLTGKILQHEENRERPTAYSSLGTASLVFPVNKIIELCANRLGRDLLQNEIMRKEMPPERVDVAVKSFLQANQVENTTLLEQVARNAQNNMMRIALDARQLDRFKENEMFQMTQAYLSKAENTVDNEYSQTLDLNRRAISDKLEKVVDSEVERLLDDPAGGLYFTLAVLEKLDALLAASRRDLDKDREGMEKRRENSQTACNQTQNNFAQSFRTGPIGRGGRIKEARNRHIDTFQNYLVARFEVRKREVGIAILANLSTSIQAKRVVLQRTVDRLQFIQRQFENIERSSVGKPRTDFILAQDITTDADVEKYFTEHYNRLGASPAAALVDSKGPLHTWLNLEQENIADRILEYTRSVFDDLKEISIEQIILEKGGQIEPRKRLLDLVNRSVPFWMFRTAGVLGQEWERAKGITVVGVPDRERSIFKGESEADTQLTSTFDPYRIIVLQTKHGIPLFALTQYDDFKQSHDYVMQRKKKPLYIFPEVRPGGEKAKQVYALGIAYGFIFRSGVYYHIIPEDLGQKPIQIGNSMADSLGSFRSNEDLVKNLSKRIDDQISREGIGAAVLTLEAFITEPYVYELKGGAKVTNIDKAMMVKDISVGKPDTTNFDLIQEMRSTLKDFVKKVLRG